MRIIQLREVIMKCYTKVKDQQNNRSRRDKKDFLLLRPN